MVLVSGTHLHKKTVAQLLLQRLDGEVFARDCQFLGLLTIEFPDIYLATDADTYFPRSHGI